MGYKIGIYDKDRAYAVGLMNYFNKRVDIHIKACAFTEPDSLEKYVRDNNLDIILAGENIDLTSINLPIIHICEDKEKCKRDMYIYKYQNMERISDMICNFAKGKVERIYADSNVYGVFSPLGRCGKTTLAKGITYHYGSSLYIGIEEYMPKGDYVCQEEFSYYLAEKNPKLIEKIDELVHDERGSRYMYLVDSYMDMKYIAKEHIGWLVEELRKTTKISYIVFDIGQATLGNLDILEIFHKVYIPVLEDEISKRKLENFKNIFQRGTMDRMFSQFRFTEVPVIDYKEMQDFIEREGI